MTLAWAELLRNPGAISAFYTSVPSLTSITVRSLHFDRRGPTLTMRFDLPEFPDRPLPEWVENECDRFQCQLQFLAVDDVVMRDWNPPVTADVIIDPLGLRRIRVRVIGDGMTLSLSSSDSVTVGRMSAYRAPAGGVDCGRHYYVGKADQIRFRTIPGVWEKSFYERV